jgi:hypothetical protein
MASSSKQKNGRSYPSWGWEHPQCRGPNAVPLFIDDLQRVLSGFAPGGADDAAGLAQTQTEVDMLLGKYVLMGVAPQIFGGQTVELKLGTDRTGVTHVVPIFSASLKQQFMQILGQAK